MEKDLRGGVCMVSKRFDKANNPQCLEYDRTKPNSWITYLDANNLYGWAMKQLLPVGDGTLPLVTAVSSPRGQPRAR